MTLDSAVLLYTYISRFSVNPHHQQMRKIWQSCCHKFYPPAVPHCVFQLLSQMAHVRFHRRKWVLTRLRQQDRTQRPTRRNRGVSDGALSLPSERSARSQTSPGRVSERRTLPLLGLGRERSRRTQKAFGAAMRLCASLLRRRCGPAGLQILSQGVEVLHEKESLNANPPDNSIISVTFVSFLLETQYSRTGNSNPRVHGVRQEKSLPAFLKYPGGCRRNTQLHRAVKLLQWSYRGNPL